MSRALNEEIRRLSNLVDDFNLDFHSDPIVINLYKKELHCYVERGLGSNLRARLSNALALNIESVQADMTGNISFVNFAKKNYLYNKRNFNFFRKINKSLAGRKESR